MLVTRLCGTSFGAWCADSCLSHSANAVADAANQVEQAVSSADELTCIKVTELSNAVAAKPGATIGRIT